MYLKLIMSRSSVNDVNLGRSELHLAAVKNDLQQVEKLLSLGADINAKDKIDQTPLHDAAIENKNETHFKVAKTLLKNGANVNALDSFRRVTPLWYLVKSGNKKIVQLFLNYGADIRVADKEGHSLMFVAAKNDKNVEIVQLLIDLGLDVNRRATDGSTPLEWACENIIHENMKIIKCLLKNNADINPVDNFGCTPLFQAVRISRFEEKIKKKNLKFILEHTDFNNFYYNHILTLEYEAHADYLWKIILEHLAKLKSLDISVHPSLLKTISEQEKYKKYYKECHDELLRAKSTLLKNSWVTFFNLLVDGRKKLKNYAGNEELIDDFKKSNCMTKFPIYGATMDENVRKGLQRRKLFDKSASLLSDSLPIFDSTHLIVYDVFNCIMSKKDLVKFCEKL